MPDFHWMSAETLTAGYRLGRFTPVDVAEALLARIEAVHPRLNAFCHLDPPTTRRQAEASAARWARQDPVSALDGVPLSIKDLILTKGWPTLRGSLTVDPTGPWEEDGPAVARAREAGLVFLGKVTTPEFGWKAVTDSPRTGVTRNPWDPTRTPGGSSGGSAAAVAAGLGPLSIASDGGGSIRVPAAFSGVVGLKPSFGRVPAYPPPYTGTLGCYGPIARTVRDAAALMNVMKAPDVRDWQALPADPRDYLADLEGGVRGARIAYSPRLGYVPWVDPAVEAAVAAAAVAFLRLGAEVVEVGAVFDHPGEAFVAHFFGGIADLMGELPPERRAQVEPALQEVAANAASLTVADIFRAQRSRNALGHQLRTFMADYDFLITPTVAVPPFEAGTLRPQGPDGEPLLDWTPFTYPFNLAQNPAVTVPCGLTSEGLPIGFQIVGRMYDDPGVLRAARAYEAAHPLAPAHPPALA
jgi:aspartyl-tRNA(Asn)/glutamyl-tRNA(Gln) amidotransferase subunit A